VKNGISDADILDYFRELRESDGLSIEAAIEDTCQQFDQETRERILAIVQPPARAPRRGPAAAPPKAPRRGPRWDDVAPLARAPYRFAPLNEVIVPAEEAAREPLNQPIDGGLCVDIVVDWRAETLVLIGEQSADKQAPVRALKVGDDWAIPASSLRGMIRSVLEIAAFGRLTQIDGHLRFPLRDFEHPLYRDHDERTHEAPVENIEPSPISSSSKVQAGWLTRAGDGYAITPCQDWAYVPVEDLGKTFPSFTVTASLDAKYAAVSQHRPWRDAVGAARRFHTLEPKHRDGRSLCAPDPQGNVSGVLVLSGQAPNAGRKKYEYVFLDTPGPSSPVRISETAWAQFELMNTRQGRRRREPEGSWKELSPVLRGGRVPVFFVGSLAEQGRDFAFGLTRLFKIPHLYSVAEMLDRSGPRAGDLRHGLPQGVAPGRVVDFVENLFGFVFEPQEGDADSSHKPADFARRGKVAFSFASLTAEQFEEGTPIDVVMAAPRASFAPFYLAGPIKDYSSLKSTLAGRKRYVLHKGDGGDAETRMRSSYRSLQQARAVKRSEVSDDQKATLRFLAPRGPSGGRFQSVIRLHNVTRAEAGAILWALDFGDRAHYRHVIGRAKGFGAGRLGVEAVSLDGNWNSTGALVSTIDAPALVRAFTHHMETAVKGWASSPPVKALLAFADPAAALDVAQPAREDPLVTWLSPLSLTGEPIVSLSGETRPQKVNPFQQLRKVSGLRHDGAQASEGAPDRFLDVAPPTSRKR
jgi:CRISPR-associated protein (TIGR03986 family)